MVCRATTGAHAPRLGVCLDRTGLLGSCIQTRQLRHCNDTETDGRVDAEACRHLGVRSIVVLPLLDGDELFGVVAILSPQPNAFGQRDLQSLQALTDRILESRKKISKATPTVPRKESGSFLHKLEEVVPQNKTSSSQSEPGSESGLRRRKHPSRGNDIWTPILGVLVIGAAMLLGTVVGWRLGWQKGFRDRSLPHRAIALSKIGVADHTVLPATEVQLSCAPASSPCAAAVTGVRAR